MATNTRSVDTSAAGLASLIDAFESQTLPKADWTHEAHVLTALFYVVEAPAPLEKMRVGIQRLNAAHGVVQTESSGYHETITCFYVWALQRYVEMERQQLRVYPGPTAWQLANGALCYATRELPLSYYSRERLLSATARLSFIEPDIHPLSP